MPKVKVERVAAISQSRDARETVITAFDARGKRHKICLDAPAARLLSLYLLNRKEPAEDGRRFPGSPCVPVTSVEATVDADYVAIDLHVTPEARIHVRVPLAQWDRMVAQLESASVTDDAQRV